MKLHWTLLFFFALILLGSIGLAWQLALLQLFVFVGLFGSVLLHEFGHSLVGKRYGYAPREIILMPIGGVASFARLPEEPGKEFLVTIAGPAVNFVIVLALGLAIGFEPIWATFQGVFDTHTGGAAGGSPAVITTFAEALAVVAGINLFIGLFNLLPGFPMDGGRMLRAALTPSLGYLRSTIVAGRVGLVVALLMIFWGATLFFAQGVFSGVILMILALFVGFMGTMEQTQVRMRFALKGLRAGEALVVPQTRPTPDWSVGQLRGVLSESNVPGVPVLNVSGYLVGWIDRQALEQTPQQWGDVRVQDVMTPRWPWVRPQDPLDEVFQSMMERRLMAIPVVERNGQFHGILSLLALHQFAARRLQSGQT